MPLIETKAILRKFCIEYIGKYHIKEISYNQLREYLVKEIGFEIKHNDKKLFNEDLFLVFTDLTSASLSGYYDHKVPTYVPDSIPADEWKRRQEEIGQKIEDYNKGYLDRLFEVKESVFHDHENELRLKKSEEDSQSSIRIAKWSYRIAILALVITGIQLLTDLWDVHIGKDFQFERTTMHSDSTLILQNQEIINLLKNQNGIIEYNRKQDSVYHQKSPQKRNRL